MQANEENGSTATSLMVFLLGVAVGATVAVLFAPQAGEETRAQITEQATKLRDKATELKNSTAEFTERASAVVQKLGDQAGNAVEAVTGTVRKAVQSHSPGRGDETEPAV